MNEQGPQEAHNEEAWQRYIAAERRELQMRREGRLARILGRPPAPRVYRGAEAHRRGGPAQGGRGLDGAHGRTRGDNLQAHRRARPGGPAGEDKGGGQADRVDRGAAGQAPSSASPRSDRPGGPIGPEPLGLLPRRSLPGTGMNSLGAELYGNIPIGEHAGRGAPAAWARGRQIPTTTHGKPTCTPSVRSSQSVPRARCAVP
jgi:hypothetical protein